MRSLSNSRCVTFAKQPLRSGLKSLAGLALAIALLASNTASVQGGRPLLQAPRRPRHQQPQQPLLQRRPLLQAPRQPVTNRHSPSPDVTATPTATATANPSATPTATPTPGGSATPSPTPTPVVSPTPTPPFEGNFVIGDLDAVVGNRVTFHSPQWANVNHLSGGGAPRSFKGFARFPDPNPAECGGTWTTTPGNSSHPPDDIPEFITAIAASSVRKTGSIISGDIPMLVVIQTDPNPGGGHGNPKTGTVVSIICGPTPGPSCTPNTFKATMTGDQEVPPNNSTATGAATVVLNPDPAPATVTVDVTFSGLSGNATAAHIHGPAMPGATAPPIIRFDGFPCEHLGDLLKYFPDYSGADSDAARWTLLHQYP